MNIVNQQKSISFATWNIGGGVLGESHQTDGKPAIAYYSSVIKKYFPDIICIQEGHSYKTNEVAQPEWLATDLGYKYFKTFALSESHLAPNAFLNLSILSKFPLSNFLFSKFENPKLSSIGPNGDQWTLFDKGYFSCLVKTPYGDTTVFNCHCFPLHFFNGNPTEQRFVAIWRQLLNVLKKMRLSHPVLAAIDLNSPDITGLLSEELDKNKYLNATIDIPTTTKGVQQDYILHTKEFKDISKIIIDTKSDHSYCQVFFERVYT
ncbi:MAG: endonuclease/exonuclease/phosphatase family protein [Candidatus Electrothrix communis]|nr:MAG: endonuclease/exonuclease/phosphatase family protein [Candidatus Electrothrix communis]